jgi:hypothetical protein
MTEGQNQPAEPQILIDQAHMAGVWANFARVAHSPYEFTLDFARIDYAQNPPQGIVVARVSLSPLMVTQLIDALNQNWALYAQRTMPPEVTEDADHRPDDHGPAQPGLPDNRP